MNLQYFDCAIFISKNYLYLTCIILYNINLVFLNLCWVFKNHEAIYGFYWVECLYLKICFFNHIFRVQDKSGYDDFYSKLNIFPFPLFDFCHYSFSGILPVRRADIAFEKNYGHDFLIQNLTIALHWSNVTLFDKLMK